MDVGMRIKKLRLEKGLTQEELGELLGVKKAAIQKYESNQVQNLKQETIRKLCKIFQVSPGVFLFTEEELRLGIEVGLLEQMERLYGKEFIELLGSFFRLDDDGRSKVVGYASDLESLQEMRKSHLDSRLITLILQV